MATRDKAAVDDFEGDLGREPLRGEQTTIDDSYLDGLSSKLDSEPRLVAPPPRPVTKRGNGAAPPDPPLVPDVSLSPTGPVRQMSPPGEEEEELEEIQELGSFDAQPIPCEPTQIEEEDELAAVATKIFVGDDAGKVAQLEVVAGRDRGKTFPLSAETTCVGRGIDNDVILTDIAVSRRHLKVHRRDGYWELEDLGSGNGTIRNGKKVRGRMVLLAGDRLELGNTTFLFAWDGVPPPGALESTSALDMSGPMPAMPPKSVPVRAATEQIPRPAAPPAAGPNKLIILGGAGLGILLITLIVIVKLSGGPSAPEQVVPAGSSVAELQTTGVSAFTGRQWDVALASFEQLAKLAPNDPSVRDYITRCQEERQAEQVLAQARLLSATNPGGAITSLAGIPPTSVYAAEAAALRNEVTVRRVGQLLTLIQSARQEAAPDSGRILALVDEGLTLDRGNAQLQRIRSEVTAGTPVEPASGVEPAAPGPTTDQGSDESGGGAERSTKVAGGRPPRQPANASREPQQPRAQPSRPTSASTARVLQTYRSGRFREAADAASAIADSSSGRTADQARALARDIDRFSQAWSAAQAARGQPSAIRNLESALRLDRSISGGHYSAQIQPLLLAAHTQNARAAWQSGRYASACGSVQAALRIDSSNAAVSRMSRDCAAKARDLYEQAYAMRTRDPGRARELWRQVLQMVSRDNEYYGRAYERLNNSPSAGGRDEDE